jgi:divalent metal cation (Fe/Co/Zn/Cd) transporter
VASELVKTEGRKPPEAHTMAASLSTKEVIYAALLGNLLVAVTKGGAAVWTGSSAMLSETVHSFVDTLNEALLLYGFHRAGRRPDLVHPLGYGRKIYFWSFIVALMVFVLGSAVSIYQGIAISGVPTRFRIRWSAMSSSLWRSSSKVDRGGSP